MLITVHKFYLQTNFNLNSLKEFTEFNKEIESALDI